MNVTFFGRILEGRSKNIPLIYGTLNKYVNHACDAWVTNHPGTTMTIYDVSIIVRIPLCISLLFLEISKQDSRILEFTSSTGIF